MSVNPLYGPIDDRGQTEEPRADTRTPIKEEIASLVDDHEVHIAETAARLRLLARSQVAMWQKLPALALEADGRTGHSGDYQKMIARSRLELRGREQSLSERGRIDLDLMTGEFKSPHSEKLSPDHIVARLDPKSLDAETWIEKLAAEARRPHGSYYDAAEKERWREKLRAKHGLEKPELGRSTD